MDSTTYGSCKIYNPDLELIVHKSFVFGVGTSNSAEYLTLLSPLNLALELGIKSISILMDSRLVVGQLCWGWRCNYEHLRVIRDKVLEVRNKFTNFEMNAVTRKIIVAHLGH